MKESGFTKAILTTYQIDILAFVEVETYGVFTFVKSIVVQDDLYRALEEGEIQAAGLDVYESEPLPKDSKLFNVLNRDRLIMTPHTAWGSVEARTRLIEEIRLNIKAFLAGENRSRIV